MHAACLIGSVPGFSLLERLSSEFEDVQDIEWRWRGMEGHIDTVRLFSEDRAEAAVVSPAESEGGWRQTSKAAVKGCDLTATTSHVESAYPKPITHRCMQALS